MGGDVVTVNSWDALNDRVTIWVEVERPGVVLRIPLRELTYHEWLSVELDEPMPAPPVIAGKGGIKQYDRSNPDYQRRVGEVYERWTYRRLLRALQIKVPGEDEDEKIRALSEMSAPLLRALMQQLEAMHMANKARIENRAGSFQPDDATDAEGVRAAWLDTDAMGGFDGAGA